jgi:hypothetical protein
MKTDPPHGTRARYRRGCSCLSCRIANARSRRERHRRRNNLTELDHRITPERLTWEDVTLRQPEEGAG